MRNWVVEKYYIIAYVIVRPTAPFPVFDYSAYSNRTTFFKSIGILLMLKARNFKGKYRIRNARKHYPGLYR